MQFDPGNHMTSPDLIDSISFPTIASPGGVKGACEQHRQQIDSIASLNRRLLSFGVPHGDPPQHKFRIARYDLLDVHLAFLAMPDRDSLKCAEYEVAHQLGRARPEATRRDTLLDEG